jgi:hypothetical protein
MKLTKKSVDAIKPIPKDQVHWDDELRGFGIRTKPSALKSFLIQYRNRQGRSRRLTIGNYGRLTPEEARRLLSEVERGVDPTEQRLQERNITTVADLADEYLSKAEAGLIIGRKGLPKKASTLECDRGRISRHIVPLLGRKPLKNLTTADIKRCIPRHQKVYPVDVRLIWPVAKWGRPRRRSIPDILSVPAEDMLADAKWQTVSWRTGRKASLRRALPLSASVPPMRIRASNICRETKPGLSANIAPQVRRNTTSPICLPRPIRAPWPPPSRHDGFASKPTSN